MNQVLSENRANAVKDYLTTNGVDETRIQQQGMEKMIQLQITKQQPGVQKQESGNEIKELLSP